MSALARDTYTMWSMELLCGGGQCGKECRQSHVAMVW